MSESIPLVFQGALSVSYETAEIFKVDKLCAFNSERTAEQTSHPLLEDPPAACVQLTDVDERLTQ